MILELSLEDVRIGQDEKGQNQGFPGRENTTTCKGLEKRNRVICLRDTLLVLVGHKKGLGWKEFEGGKGSEMGLQRQAGPEHTGSLRGPQTQAEGLGPCLARGEYLSREEAYLGFQDLGGKIPGGAWNLSVGRGLSLPFGSKVQSRFLPVPSLPPGQVLHEYYLG